MKFHKQLKVPGMSQDQIIEALRNSELEMRPMRTEYSFEKKFKTTNTMSDFNIVIEDEQVEVQANGDYNVWSFVPYVARDLLGMTDKYLTTRYTKSDIGYERRGWVEYGDNGMEKGKTYIDGATGEEKTV
jgi:hypothetical protein|tara:strand:- start:62 stop:451 length:390 start_codon:yes stop_codon:yes gene_type:complete